MIDPAILTLASVLRLAQPEPINLRELECLADVIYMEARGEPLAAQVAVAGVVLRRGSPCRVASNRRHVAASHGKPRRERAAWTQAAEVAVLVSTGAVAAPHATHFHDVSVTPYWTRGMELVAHEGRMKFWRGK